MANNNRCQNCGDSYLPSDTYCMGCGITIMSESNFELNGSNLIHWTKEPDYEKNKTRLEYLATKMVELINDHTVAIQRGTDLDQAFFDRSQSYSDSWIIYQEKITTYSLKSALEKLEQFYQGISKLNQDYYDQIYDLNKKSKWEQFISFSLAFLLVAFRLTLVIIYVDLIFTYLTMVLYYYILIYWWTGNNHVWPFRPGDNLNFQNNIKKLMGVFGKSTSDSSDSRNRHIPQQVKMEVMRRDNGSCQMCGSTENLEFGHIIPFNQGGSNTSNNLQIECMTCNRSKGANL